MDIFSPRSRASPGFINHTHHDIDHLQNGFVRRINVHGIRSCDERCYGTLAILAVPESKIAFDIPQSWQSLPLDQFPIPPVGSLLRPRRREKI